MKSEGKVWLLFDAINNKKTKPLSLVQAQMMLLTLKVKTLHQYFIWTPGWEEWQSVPSFLTSGQKYFTAALPPEPLMHKSSQNETNRAASEEVTKTVRIPEAMPEEKSSNSSPYYTQIVPADSSPKKEDYGYYYNEFTGDDLSLSGIPARPSLEIVLSRAALGSPQDRRGAARHDFKIEVILVSKKGTSFRTQSRNISLSGTLLEDVIPQEFFHYPFDMILVNKFEKNPRKNRVYLQGHIIGDLRDPRRLTFVDPSEELTLKLTKLMQDYEAEQKKFRKDVI